MGQVKSSGKLLLIVAPSGTGKSTLIKKIKSEIPSLLESISYTTRSMRPGEVDGVSYFFVNKEQFEEKIKNNDLIEWAQVHANYYGTSKKFVEEQLEKGTSLLFDLDVQGVDSFKKHFGEKAVVIFIAPPSIEILEERLRNRGTETEANVVLRISNARKEVLRQHDFDYCVVNDDFDRAYNELKNIFLNELKK